MKKKTIFLSLALAFVASTALASCTGKKKPVKTDDPVVVPSTTGEKTNSSEVSTPVVEKVKITFKNSNASSDKVVEANKNESFTINENPGEMNNYRFAGWKLNDTDSVYENGESISLTGDITLTAVWVQTNTLMIVYPDSVHEFITVDANSKYKLQVANDLLARDFLGYATTKNASTADYQPGDEIEIAEEPVVLYTLWDYADVTVSYEVGEIGLNYGIKLADTTVKYDKTFSAPGNAISTLVSSAKFVGWATSKEKAGLKQPIVDFLPGETVDPKLLDVDESNEATLYAVFVSNGTYAESVGQTPTLERDGIYTYTNESNISYAKVIHKETIFASYIDTAFSFGANSVINSTILQGSIKVGDLISIKLKSGIIKNDVEVLGIEKFKETVESAEKGDAVAILVNIAKDDIISGYMISTKDQIIESQEIRVKVYNLLKTEGGIHTPYFKGVSLDLYFGTSSVKATVTATYDENMEETELALPGTVVYVDLELDYNAMLFEGLDIRLRQSGKTRAEGKIVTRLDK